MKRIASIFIALCMTSGAALAQDQAEAKDSGAWFELNYSYRPLTVEDELVLPVAQGGFFAGYKFGPVSAGIGIELTRLSSSVEFGGVEDNEAITQLLVAPGVRYAFLRSADNRVELFGQLDIGLGKIYLSDSDGNDFNEPSRFAYQVGPGVRYWVHPQFGVGAMTGLRGEYLTFEDPDGAFSSTVATTTITTSLQLTGLF